MILDSARVSWLANFGADDILAGGAGFCRGGAAGLDQGVPRGDLGPAADARDRGREVGRDGNICKSMERGWAGILSTRLPELSNGCSGGRRYGGLTTVSRAGRRAARRVEIRRGKLP